MIEQITVCTRCGQAIKNIYYWRGASYGPECIHIVSGHPVERWVVRDGTIDEKATAEREAQQEAKVAAYRAAQAAYEATKAENRVAYKWFADVLESLVDPRWLRQYPDRDEWYAVGCEGLFTLGLVASLRNGEKPTEWSDKRLRVALEIYAKAVSGARKGSKAYEAAYQTAEDKMGPSA